MNLSEVFDVNVLFPYVFIGLCVVAVIAVISLVLLIINMVKLNKMKKNYRIFMNGKTAENLEDSMLEHFEKIEELLNIARRHTSEIKKINDDLQLVYTKVGIVKYDAFNEMGGKLSFALTLLDNSNNGFVMNAMHSREGCYTYIKEIIKGDSFITLSDEEKQSLNKAMGIEL